MAGLGLGDHHAGLVLLEDLQGALGGVGETHPVVVRLQDLAQALLHRRVVLDDQDADFRSHQRLVGLADRLVGGQHRRLARDAPASNTRLQVGIDPGLLTNR